MPHAFRTLATLTALAALGTTAALASPAPSPPGGPPASPAPVASAAAVRPGSAAVAEGTVVYDWPIAGAVVVRPFDDPAEPWLPGHRGADLAAPPGTAVLAAADGVVAFAGQVAGKPVVSIDHADGLRTTYEPVTAAVVRGATVARGEQIGTVAGGPLPGHDVADVLHWGARSGPTGYVDPVLLIGAPVVVRLWE